VIRILALIVIVIATATFLLKPNLFGQKTPVKSPPPSPGSVQNNVYNNTKFGFQFDYPNTWQVTEISPKGEKNIFSILQITPEGYKSQVPPIKLLYAPNPKKLKLPELENSIPSSTRSTPIFYASDDIYTLSGQGLPAYFRNDGNCANDKCQIYTFSVDSNVYQLVNFNSTQVKDQQNVFSQVFNSLKFSPQDKTSTNSASPQ
jgi:hypothetical protein